MKVLSGVSLPASLLAFGGLVFSQVLVALVYEAAGSKGSYSFAESSSLTLSEIIKCTLSYVFLVGSARSIASEMAGESLGVQPDKADSVRRRIGVVNDYLLRVARSGSIESIAGLAAMYAINNQLAFVLFLLTDPGTIALVKTGSTIISAVILKMFGRSITELQWIAMSLQFCGIIFSQYNEKKGGSIYPITSYLLLFVSVGITAFCGCVNDHLNKVSKMSLHAFNFYLYVFGTGINFCAYIMAVIRDPKTPGFFEGYDRTALVLLICNSLMGLIITSVYKYADAIVKSIAHTVSTALLLIISATFFNAKLGLSQMMGVAVVFLSTYFYFIAPRYSIRHNNGPDSAYHAPAYSERVSKEESVSSPKAEAVAKSNKFNRNLFYAGFGVALFTLGMNAASLFKVATVSIAPVNSSEIQAPANVTPNGIVSPLATTLAFVRWNAPHPERIPLIDLYRPFFGEMHISMNNNTEEMTVQLDGSPKTGEIYDTVADVMELLLKDRPDITGLMYFHFDTWVQPLRFGDLDLNKIWFPVSDDPPMFCFRENPQRHWWAFGQGLHNKAMDSLAEMAELQASGSFSQDPKAVKLNIDPKEFCYGHYIDISRIYYKRLVFHEIGIPTIVKILDKTFRKNEYDSVVSYIGDCVGHCCVSIKYAYEVENRRCGHRLDFTVEEVVKAQFDRLREDAKVLVVGNSTGSK
ncbi:hypothetical protein HDU96_000290 [Phlyctochytrium bullatum]|nr:hypothetical protein HDU96_000290 [Phlyctochytrium bullatum]